jgi:hypothetical protein
MYGYELREELSSISPAKAGGCTLGRSPAGTCKPNRQKWHPTHPRNPTPHQHPHQQKKPTAKSLPNTEAPPLHLPARPVPASNTVPPHPISIREQLPPFSLGPLRAFTTQDLGKSNILAALLEWHLPTEDLVHHHPQRITIRLSCRTSLLQLETFGSRSSGLIHPSVPPSMHEDTKVDWSGTTRSD